jgi:hypothetical protein
VKPVQIRLSALTAFKWKGAATAASGQRRGAAVAAHKRQLTALVQGHIERLHALCQRERIVVEISPDQAFKSTGGSSQGMRKT